MNSDPILDEIQATRKAISKASGDDIRRIAEAARKRQVASGRKIVRLTPRRVRPVRKVS